MDQARLVFTISTFAVIGIFAAGLIRGILKKPDLKPTLAQRTEETEIQIQEEQN